MNSLRLLLIIAGIGMNINLNAQSKIIFSRSKGALNTGGTLNLMVYNTVNKTTNILLKGSVKGRGEYNVTTSPDNTKIIFNTYRFSGWKLGIADFKNQKITNVQRLTNRSNYEFSPMFSPDGLKIAYQEFNWSTQDADIFIADQNGKNAKHFIKASGGDRTPDWTMDNKRIVFTSGRDGDYDIYVKSVEGGGAKNITNHNAHDFAPSTSKVNDKIAFLSDRGGKVNLYVMGLDGSNLVKLTAGLKTDDFNFNGFENTGCWAYKTCWAPDGKQIVFNVMVDGNLEIFIINSDGSGLDQITKNSDSDISPYWAN